MEVTTLNPRYYARLTWPPILVWQAKISIFNGPTPLFEHVKFKPKEGKFKVTLLNSRFSQLNMSLIPRLYA